MKNKKLVLIILSFLFVVAATLFLGKYSSDHLPEMVNDQEQITAFQSGSINKFNVKLYTQIFFVLFGTICCPFIFSLFSSSINKQNLWKLVLGIEVFGLVLIFIVSPPDIISKILLFIIWQLPVVVNMITLKLLLKKQ